MMPFIRVVALALALATSSAWSSHPSESARNQYGAREDTLQPQMLTEATDHLPRVQHNSTNNIREKKRIPWRSREKRSYLPLSGQVVYSEPYPSLNIWRPPVYQISRPYYIPVYGVQGGYRIFFPPQPLYVNPGVPKENPNGPFKGPTYLPPREQTTEATATTMTIDDRFNGGDNNDDKVVWPDEEVQRSTTTTTAKPTRRTRPPGAVKTPPLIHSPTDPEGFADASVESSAPMMPPPAARPQRPSTPNEPSRCVWAIISCCSSTNQISYDCFDQRGCTGAFWDDNPCDSDFARAAVATALEYYNKK